MKRSELKAKIDSMTETEIDEKFQELSDIFRPNNASVLLDLSSNDMTIFQARREYLDMIWAFKIYVDSGMSEQASIDLGIKTAPDNWL